MQPRLRRNPWTPLATALAFASLASGAEEEPPSAALPAAPVKIERAGPGNVLVVYNENAPDGREIADYYAKRRGVPEENLLGLRVPPKTDTNYRQFFESMLKPLREKLSSKAADGVAFSERILYILMTPGLPHTVYTGHGREDHPLGHKSWVGGRSTDQWLISPEENFEAGLDAKTGKPGLARPPYPVGLARANGVPIFRIKRGKSTLGRLIVAGRKLEDIPYTEAGKLGDLLVKGKKLGECEVGTAEAPQKLGEIAVGTEEKPLKLGDVALRPLVLGARGGDVKSPFLGAFVGENATSFRELRRKLPGLRGKYLVMRLGRDGASARRAVDGALYAERYLRGAPEGGGPELSIWLDQKFNFAQDQVGAQVACCALAHPGAGLFREGAAGPLGPWKLVIDNRSAEIGMKLKDGSQHGPTVSAKIAKVEGDRLVLTRRQVGRQSTPTSVYFCAGWEVAVKGGEAKATVASVDVKANCLQLSTTEGFKPGDEITRKWPGRFPSRDCFFFFGFYGLGKYEDVFAFPPGSVGVHVDSACMKWATRAMDRGIAGTFGVIAEPFSAGIPYGQIVLATLARGNDLAEAMGSSILIGHRWMGVSFGDPLYAPFREEKVPDTTAPVLSAVEAAAGAGGVRISARLAGDSPDELAEVALFRVDYGPTRRYGSTSDFYLWPEPGNPGKVEGRRYSGYARELSRLITGLEEDRRYYFRVVARDPAGNETESRPRTFRFSPLPAPKGGTGTKDPAK